MNDIYIYSFSLFQNPINYLDDQFSKFSKIPNQSGPSGAGGVGPAPSGPAGGVVSSPSKQEAPAPEPAPTPAATPGVCLCRALYPFSAENEDDLGFGFLSFSF